MKKRDIIDMYENRINRLEERLYSLEDNNVDLGNTVYNLSCEINRIKTQDALSKAKKEESEDVNELDLIKDLIDELEEVPSFISSNLLDMIEKCVLYKNSSFYNMTTEILEGLKMQVGIDDEEVIDEIIELVSKLR